MLRWILESLSPMNADALLLLDYIFKLQGEYRCGSMPLRNCWIVLSNTNIYKFMQQQHQYICTMYKDIKDNGSSDGIYLLYSRVYRDRSVWKIFRNSPGA